MSPSTRGLAVLAMLLGAAVALAAAPGTAPHVHGMWVWKGSEILASPESVRKLLAFCQREGVTEIYVSAFSHGEPEDTQALARAVSSLHGASIRFEALLSSTDADEDGKHREKLLEHVRAVVAFNKQHAEAPIDGIHLDIEPQQRPENKGAGNLRFLPGLVATYRAVRVLTDSAGLSVNADIQNKLLKGSAQERLMLLESLPRLTLMLYELDTPTDGSSSAQEADRVRSASHAFLEMAYRGLQGEGLARLVIALRTPDYGALLPQMLQALDAANSQDPHYQGWARHSYNDMLKSTP
jgi:hypothetical protein